MMMMKGVLVVVLLMMVSSVSASGDRNGFSSCTCSYVDGRVITGTIVTSPDGSGSICTCPVSQKPPQTPTQNPPSAPIARNPLQPQHPAFQLPPIPFMDPRAQSCLQEFLDSNACMAQERLLSCCLALGGTAEGCISGEYDYYLFCILMPLGLLDENGCVLALNDGITGLDICPLHTSVTDSGMV
ncbi:hypothetical protein Ddye_009017 [Dipteronia dyeriana]|uniref:Uncharacterized protein n=1 Tax=Dipteronia dyeriana TaxID=168575 RepID=A0AAD9XAL6_9ROSI|nr:hypothetical protein Ddye_009017 [Dipteronia dyeriana]